MSKDLSIKNLLQAINNLELKLKCIENEVSNLEVNFDKLENFINEIINNNSFKSSQLQTFGFVNGKIVSSLDKKENK